MSRITLAVLVSCLAVALGYPAAPIALEYQGVIPHPENIKILMREPRAADPQPTFHKHYGLGYGHGYGHGHGYGGHGCAYCGGGHGYPIHGGGNSFAQSSANAGSFSSPFGSASFANAHSNAGAYGR